MAKIAYNSIKSFCVAYTEYTAYINGNFNAFYILLHFDEKSIWNN